MKKWTSYLPPMIAFAAAPPLVVLIISTQFPSLGSPNFTEYLGLAGLGLSLYLAIDKIKNLKPFVKVKFIVQPADQYSERSYLLKAEYTGSPPVVLDLAGLTILRKPFNVPTLTRWGMLNRITLLKKPYLILVDRDVLTAMGTSDDSKNPVRSSYLASHSGFIHFWASIQKRTLSADHPEASGSLCRDEVNRIVRYMNLSGVIRIVGFFRDTQGYTYYSEPMKYQVQDVMETSSEPHS